MKTNPRGRKAKVGNERVSREEGYLYFIDNNGYIARTKMNRGGRARGSKSSRKASKKSSRSRSASSKKRRR
jgi:hypothetical protein